MDKKDIKRETIIRIAIIIGIIIVLNIISVKYFTRFDISKNKTFTLSPVSKTLVGNLNDKIVIKAFISDNLPAPYNNVRRNVMDLLGDYKSYSKGNLTYEFYNPTGEGDTSLEKEANKFGIPAVSIQNIEKDKAGYIKAYIGLVYLYQGKQEVTQFLQPNDNMEYEISTRIKKISTDQRTKIGFLAGHGEYDITKMQTIYKLLNDSYQVSNINASRNQAIPDSIKVLIIMGPKQGLSENEKFIIDQYIMKGGNVAWLLNKVVPNVQQNMILGELVQTNLDDMLLSYGVKINNDLVRDLNCAQILQPSQIEGFSVPIDNQFFPVITNIDNQIAAFNNLPSVVLPYVSSIDLGAAQGKELVAKPLLTSSDKSGKDEGFFILNFERFKGLTPKALDTMFALKNLVVGATYQGKFKSFFTGKTPPSDTSKDAPVLNITPVNESTKESKMIAIGDGDFAWEENRPPKENLVFFLDLVEYLADDVGLSQIRNKETSESKIENISDSTKKVFKYFNLIVPPALVLLVGLYRWNKKKTRRKLLSSN
ncbi:MAG TPA: GldG family protein [Ignavibacteria bacterium]